MEKPDLSPCPHEKVPPETMHLVCIVGQNLVAQIADPAIFWRSDILAVFGGGNPHSLRTSLSVVEINAV